MLRAEVDKAIPALLGLVSLCLGVTFSPPPAAAVSINLTLSPTSDSPSFDPDGSRLTAIMNAAATRWEDIIEDDFTFNVTIGYQDIGGTGLGFACYVSGPNCIDGVVLPDMPNDAAIAIDTRVGSGGAERLWYFDTTPTNHSEFDMQQRLYRDLEPGEQDIFFSGAPADLLEVEFFGQANASAPAAAQNGFDALSVALHEMGHIMGMMNEIAVPESNDGDYDIDSDFIHGATAGAKTASGSNSDHLRANNALMAPSVTAGVRTLPSATDVFAIAAGAVPGWTDIDLPRKDFLGGADWNTPFNWEGNQVPGTADDAYVRHGGGVTLSSAAHVENLYISENADVATSGSRLIVDSAATIMDFGSRIIVSAGPDTNQFQADELTIDSEGRLQMSGGKARIDVDLDVEAAGSITGRGEVEIAGSFDLEGTLSVDGGTMLLSPIGGGQIDLDGDSGNGTINVISGTSTLVVDGPLADSFDGALTVGDGNMVTFASSWTLGQDGGSGGELNLQGGAGEPDQALLIGAPMVVNHGAVTVTGMASIDADIEFQTDAVVSVAAGGQLELAAAASFSGGTYTGDGALVFNGNTSVNSSTTIDMPGGVVDLDGDIGGLETITLNNRSLTLNVAAIDRPGQSPAFNGDTIEVNGSLARLTVNLTDPDASWEMAGTLDIASNDLLASTSLAGSDVRLSGDTNVDGLTRVTANVDLSGSLTTNDATTTLTLDGGRVNILRSTATVSGPGQIVLDAGSQLRIEDGFNEPLNLVSRGTVQPGLSTGDPTIGTYLQDSTGTLEIEIGGLLPGSEHDQLNVSGAATLAGSLRAGLIDLGLGVFEPELGDMFRILAARGGIFGGFTSQLLPPLSPTLGWTVDYAEFSVFLRVIAALEGDMDCDGDVDFDDINDFVFALNDPDGYQALFGVPASLKGDTDGDGDLDFDDIDEFVNLLSQPLTASAQPVPEPATCLLMALGLCVLLVPKARHVVHCRTFV